MQLHDTELLAPRRGRMPKPSIHGCFGQTLGQGIIRAALSPRAHGLVLDVNLNTDGYCNFDCAYCDIDRTAIYPGLQLDATIMANELTKALQMVRSGQINQLPCFNGLESQVLKLRHVAIGGNGEPTLAPNFLEIVEAVMHVRARSDSFFKVVLLTNASQLHLPQVQQGLAYFTREDEVWAKLDAGTQHHLQEINGTILPLQTLLQNIQLTAVRRPVVIQSMFSSVSGAEPDANEISEFAQRLVELRDNGAQISSVQIYSATPCRGSTCAHLPLNSLSKIARSVREATGLKVEIF